MFTSIDETKKNQRKSVDCLVSNIHCLSGLWVNTALSLSALGKQSGITTSQAAKTENRKYILWYFDEIFSCVPNIFSFADN